MTAYKKLTQFGKLSLQEFLADYWQKKTAVFKNAFPNFQSPISAEELAGFSLEEALPSRIVLEHTNTSWEVQHGPFEETHFQQLPSIPWTLLVQHLDSVHADIAAILQAFSFLPSWRLEDIMVSYATDQGGVGPHFDYYDVFLIQAQGTRRWKLGQHCDNTTALLPNQDMKILADFQKQEEHLMHVGDVLYVPPGVAHWGISEGEGMTISVGFRAPSYAEILLEFAEERASFLSEDQRYRDISLKLNADPNEIPEQTLDFLQQELLTLCQDKTSLARCFGKLMTQPNLDFEMDEEQVHFSELSEVKLRDEVRAAWVQQHKQALLFLDGEECHCDIELARKLANKQRIMLNTLTENALNFCQQLYEKGLLESDA